MAEVDDRSLSIGRVFSRAFGVMGRNPILAFGLSLVLAALPLNLFNYGFAQLRLESADRNLITGVIGSAIIVFLIGLILRALVQGCLVRATIADSEGRRASLGECLSVAGNRLLPLIAVSLLFGIGVVVGMILLIVPGIMFAVACAVVVPVIVEERVGVIEAFGRASVLTRGARWKIFGLALLIAVVVWLVAAIGGVIAIALLRANINPFSLPLMLFNIVVGTLTATFWATMQTSLYVELRNWKEGPATGQLNAIFE